MRMSDRVIIGLINLNHPMARNAQGRLKQEYLHGAVDNLIAAFNAIGSSPVPKNVVLPGGFHYLTYRQWTGKMTEERAEKWRKKTWEGWNPVKRMPVKLRLVKKEEENG
jgi:hypothetical protein